MACQTSFIPFEKSSLKATFCVNCVSGLVSSRQKQLRSVGQVERWNATFTQIIKTICEDKEELYEYLPFVRMAYNSTVHSTTGETPKMIVMGRQIRLPLNVMTGINPHHDQLAHSEYVRANEA